MSARHLLASGRRCRCTSAVLLVATLALAGWLPLAAIGFLFPGQEARPQAGRREAVLAALAATATPLLPGQAMAVDAPGATAPVFVDSAIFERLEHFKDIGVPATLQDPIARAAIADGTCRSVVAPGSGPFPLDGYDFWHHNPERVDAVLKALTQLPSTSQPSKFVRAAKKQLPNACFYGFRTETNKLELYQPTALAKTLSNWHRVLCDPQCDDPAEEPQQQALTTGFICMAVCDTAKMKFTAAAISALSASTAATQSAAMQISGTVSLGCL